VTANDDKGWAEGVLTFTGHTLKDNGAASREYDALIFQVDSYPDSEKDYIAYRSFSSSQDKAPDGKFLIQLTVPHSLDPGHMIKKSTPDAPVSVAIVCWELGKGGWNDSNRVILFNRASDVAAEYVDDFTEDQYKHYYDGM
jgi:hypothetical protein